MIRNAVLHLHNEQPLLADLPTEPAAGDVALLCTNLRTVDGKRPFFVDSSASLFVFPLTQLRFVEVPTPSLARAHAGGTTVDETTAGVAGPSRPAIVPADAQPPWTDAPRLDQDLRRGVREP